MPPRQFLRNNTFQGNFSKNSSNSPEDSFDFIQPRLISRVISGILLVMIAVNGVVGNTLVLLVLKKTPTLFRKTTRYITASLATIDLLGCLVNVPMAFTAIVVRPPEDTLYRVSLVHATLTLVTVVGNHFCLVLLSIDRNDFILRSSMRKPRLTPRRVKKSLVLLLVTSVVVGILACYTSAEHPFILRRPKRTARYRMKNVLRGICTIFSVVSSGMVLQTYYRIRKYLRRHNRIMSQMEGMPNRRQAERRRERTLARIMIAIFVSFSVPYVSWSIVYVVWKQNTHIRSVDLVVIARAVFLMNYATNFWIYVAGNRNIRSAVISVLRDLFMKGNTPDNIEPFGGVKASANMRGAAVDMAECPPRGTTENIFAISPAPPNLLVEPNNAPKNKDQTEKKSTDRDNTGTKTLPPSDGDDDSLCSSTARLAILVEQWTNQKIKTHSGLESQNRDGYGTRNLSCNGDNFSCQFSSPDAFPVEATLSADEKSEQTGIDTKL